MGTKFLLAYGRFHFEKCLRINLVWRYRLNYALDLDIRQYAGVDITELDADKVGSTCKRVLERWTRSLMGFKPSPYVCTQTFAWSEEIIVGDVSTSENPFYWDKLVLNLSGMEKYDPTMPRVYRWDSIRGVMASFFGTYINNNRIGGASKLACNNTLRRVASKINYLGQQDKARKRGQPTQTPRPWAGAKCISVEGEGLYV